MSGLKDERGGVLLYVIMVITVLTILTPVLLNTVSTRQASNMVTDDQKLVSEAAASAMDAFLTYLSSNNTNNMTPAEVLTVFRQYKGWTPVHVLLPEGKTVRIKQEAFSAFNMTPNQLVDVKGLTTVGNYYVQFTAVVNDTDGDFGKDPGENRFAQKQVWYFIRSCTGSPPVLDTSVSVPVSSTSQDAIFVQQTAAGVPSSVSVTTTGSIQQAITTYLTGLTNNVTTQTTSKTDAVTACGAACKCPNCSINQVMTAINNNSGIPFYMQTNNLDIVGNTIIGSSSKPVVLIVDSLTVGSNFQIYGDLIVQNNINTSNNFAITVHAVNGSYGNLTVKGLTNASNNGTITVEGSYYTNALTVQNNADIQAKSIIISQDCTVSNNAALNTAPNNMVIGGTVNLSNNTQLTAGTDLLVAGNLNSSSNASLTTGGYIGVGGSIAMTGTTVNTGGSTTMIQLPPSGGNVGGGGTVCTEGTWSGN